MDRENVETSLKDRPKQLEAENGSMQVEAEIARSTVHKLINSELTVEQLEMRKTICAISEEKEEIKSLACKLR